jgi:hypothetical protein
MLQRYHPARVLYLNSHLYQQIFIRLRLIGYGMRSDAPSPYLDDALLDRHMSDVGEFVEIARSMASGVHVVPYDNNINAAPARREQYLRFLDKAAAHGIPVCSLAAAFDGYSPEALRVNALDAHPNAEANRLAAARIADCVLEGR